MTKKHNIVFNLSIDDLKELGIIKKRKKRSNKQKYIKYISPNYLKSSSDQMVGYSNVFNNTSNLQQENLRLQNNILEKYPMIKNDLSTEHLNLINNKFKTIEDRNNFNEGLTRYFMKQTVDTGIFNKPNNNGYAYNDNIDAPTTGGSIEFESQSSKSNINDIDENDDNDYNSTYGEIGSDNGSNVGFIDSEDENEGEIVHLVNNQQ